MSKKLRYRAVVLAAAESMEPIFAALGKLALLPGGLSSAMWLLSAAIGRKICRRALAPVAVMTATSRHRPAPTAARSPNCSRIAIVSAQMKRFYLPKGLAARLSDGGG